MPSYRVYFVNHFYFSQREFTTKDDAVSYAKSTTFDCTIYRGSDIVGGYSFFGGYTNFE